MESDDSSSGDEQRALLPNTKALARIVNGHAKLNARIVPAGQNVQQQQEGTHKSVSRKRGRGFHSTEAESPEDAERTALRKKRKAEIDAALAANSASINVNAQKVHIVAPSAPPSRLFASAISVVKAEVSEREKVESAKSSQASASSTASTEPLPAAKAAPTTAPSRLFAAAFRSAAASSSSANSGSTAAGSDGRAGMHGGARGGRSHDDDSNDERGDGAHPKRIATVAHGSSGSGDGLRVVLQGPRAVKAVGKGGTVGLVRHKDRDGGQDSGPKVKGRGAAKAKLGPR